MDDKGDAGMNFDDLGYDPALLPDTAIKQMEREEAQSKGQA